MPHQSEALYVGYRGRALGPEEGDSDCGYLGQGSVGMTRAEGLWKD